EKADVIGQGKPANEKVAVKKKHVLTLLQEMLAQSVACRSTMKAVVLFVLTVATRSAGKGVVYR
ncbi:hypothetical protein, partial [Desulfosporosinus sp. I2]|uniref:hypothetical protein n=1 Tax=Desulfosporosinus sp. I2 TaxID=1617025 RepID=UPI0005EE88AF